MIVLNIVIRKRRSLVLLLSLGLVMLGRTYAGELEISGVYQGKNLYIQNPGLNSSDGFCTIRALVNGREVVKNPTTSAYEIDLSSVKLGASVIVIVEHHDECKPVVINPQVLKQKSQFKFVRIDLKADGLGWTTFGDNKGDFYYVEKRLGNKWIMIKSQKATGLEEKNSYSVGIMNSVGDNKYRIKCIQSEGNINYSPLVTYYSKEDPVTFYPTQVDDKIILSRVARYEVLDVHGNLIVNGSKKEIEVNNLSTGLYYLVIENKTEKFYKK